MSHHPYLTSYPNNVMSPEMQDVFNHRFKAHDLPWQPDILTVSLTFYCLFALASHFIKTLLQPARGQGG